VTARLVLANALELLIGVGAATLLRAPLATSYLLGLAVVGIVSSHLALVHVSFGWTALSVLAAASFVVVWRWASWRPAVPRPSAWALAGTAALVALLVRAWPTFASKPLDDYDGWAIWGMKAKALTMLGWADPALFAAAAAEPAHLDYPLLVPSLEAVAARAMGGFDPRLVHLQFLLAGVAGMAALYGLLRGRAQPWLVWPTLVAVAAAPALTNQLLTAYADVPLAFFVAAGVLAAARWVEDGSPRTLALAVVFLGAACLTKNEGLIFAGAVFVALVLATRRVRPVLVAAVATEALLLPWQVWLAVHDVDAESFFTARLVDLQYPGIGPAALEQLLDQAFSLQEWTLLVPLFLVAVLLAAGSRLAVFAWGWMLVAFVALAGTYVKWGDLWLDYVSLSGYRVVAAIVVAVAALTPLLAAEALRQPRRLGRR
jgi:hypothetical protein